MSRGGRIPTLGYPTRTAAVLALIGEGLTDREVADRIGIAHKTVAALQLGAARRRKGQAELGRAVLFDPRLLARLAGHAAARGIGPNELARRIVETVEADGLVDAILDDITPTTVIPAKAGTQT